MINPSDYIGKTFHYLTVISYEGSVKYGKRNFYSVLCRCKCGTQRLFPLTKIKTGASKSCGCYAAIVNSARAKHGLTNHLLYGVWCSMIRRCTKVKDKNYESYGGRGISVCIEWKTDFKTFYNWCIENGYEKGLELDRRENDGDYEPGNCRFVTRTINVRNTRANRIITYNGQTMCVSEWAEHLGIKKTTLKDRILSNWSVERAFTTPVKSVSWS